MNDLQKLYDVLKRDGYYTKSFDEFKVQWQDQAYKDKVYSVVSRDGLYTKSKDEFLTKYSGQQEPLKKKEFTASASNLEKPTSGSSSRWDDVTVEPSSKKKYRTDDYIDQVQNAQRKAKAPTQKVESTFEQPKETKPPVKFDVLSDKEAMQMMAEDFGKKEFELYSQISEIDPNVLQQGEEASVEYLNKKFKGSGFVFEETGLGNSVRIKSTLNDGVGTVVNEKVVELPTGLFPGMTDVKGAAAKNAQKEIADFMNQAFLKKSEKEFLNKEVTDYGQLVKLAASNPQKYGEEFLNQYDSERWLDEQYRDLVITGKSIQREKETLQREIDAYKKSGVFNAETERLINSKQANLQDQIASNTAKYEELKDISTKLPKAAAVYFQQKEKEGNLVGLIGRQAIGGFTGIPKMIATTGVDVASALIPSEYLIPEVQKVRLKASGMSEADIRDYAAKQLRQGVLEEGLKATKDILSLGTTEEYVQSQDRNDLEKVASFLAESIGTAVSGGGNPLLTKLAFFSQSYNAIEDEMNSPEFDGMSQMEKKIMSVPYGLVIGALDRLGFNVATKIGSNPVLNKLITNTIANAFTSIPKNASIDVMQQAINESLTATMAKTGLQIVGGSLVEGLTEGTQSLAEYGMKNLYNNFVADKEVFQDVPDITTKEGFDKALSAAKEEFYYGALGGAIMSTGGVALESIAKGFNKGADEFDFFSKVIDDPNLRALIQTDIKTKITSGEITKAQAAEQIDAINKSVSILNQMPADLSNDKKMEAYNLILEKNKIDKEIDGKDPNLVKPQTDRVSEINNRLQQIAQENAVQKQATSEVPIQSEAGVGGEMAQGAPETGLKETAQKGQEEVDQYIADMGAEARIGSVINPIMDKMANAEYINDNDIDNAITTIFNEVEQLEKSDKYSPETKAAISDKLLNIAEKLDNYEFRTKTETVEVTKAGAATATRKTSEAVRKIRAEKYFNAVQATVNGQEVTLQDKNGRVEAPMPNGEVIVLDTPSMEIAEGGFEFDENDALVSVTVNDRLGNTVKLTGDQALDFAIRDRENKLGVVEQAEFDEAYQEVETRYVKEAKPAEAPVAEAAVVAEAEPTAEPVATEAVIGDIEVTEVPAVEETMDEIDRLNNILTAEDFNEVNLSDKKTNKVAAQITKAAKAISKVLPKVKFVVHSTPEAFVEATKSLDGRASEGGIYDHNTKTIHINLKNANSRTVAHEVFHALILSKVASDAEASRLTRSMIKAVIKSLKQAEGGADIISFLEDFEKDYEANIQNEEKLSELFAILSDNYKKLPPATKNIIVRFLERMAKLVGIKPMTSGEVIQFMNVLSAKVEAGEVITEQEIGEQQQAGKTKTRKQIIGEKGAERLDAMESNTRRMSNLVMAKNMTDDGKSPLEIRVATGWELGSDGKWRYETVDNIRQFRSLAYNVMDYLKKIPQNQSADASAKDVLPKELIEMYPELGDINIKFSKGKEGEGSYNHKTKTIEINVGKNPFVFTSTLLHEVQHAIQEIEGFDSGTNLQKMVDDFFNREKSLINRVKRLKNAGDNEVLLEKAKQDYREFIQNNTVTKNGKRILDANNLYNRKSGEVEARNVEKRMDMTEEERRNTLLSETAEVKKQQQIFDGGKFAPRKQKGLINLTDQEAVKYARAGVENKYEAQAIKQIGLQGTKFDKKSILDTIKKEFDRLVKNTKDYIFREDSPAIDQAIQNEIDTMINQGYSNDQIERAKRAFKPGPERNGFINQYRIAQIETISQWESYLSQSDYTPAFKYLILDAVLTNNYDLKSDRYQKRTAKTIRNFTPFDAGTLATLYVSDSNELLKDYVKIQADNSANIVESATFSSTKDGKWIKFDGGENISSEQELEDNANKLSQLVQNTYWCTKTNAWSQLRDGDFYVYVTENQQGDFDPRIAIRMKGDEVGEVRGNASSKQDLEADMLPVADKFLKEKIPNDSGKKWLDSIAYNTKVKELTDKIENKVLNIDDVMEYIDIIKDKDKFSVDYGENGLVQTLQDKFKDAKFSFGTAKTYSDINDDTLLLIAPNTTFEFSSNEESKNVQVVIGNVNFYEDFDGGKIKSITGDVKIGSDSSVKEIKSIESIGGNVNFKESNIRNLGSLKEIGGRATFTDSKVSDLGNLKRIGEVADFRRANLNSLGNLEFIGRSLWLRDSKVDDLGNLKEIGGDANFQGSRVTTLGKLKKVGANLYIEFSEVEDLGDLEFVGGDVLAEGNFTKLKTLGNLKKVGGSLSIGYESSIEDLGNLTEVGKNFYASNNKNLKSLGKLESIGYSSTIGGTLNISDSLIEDLGNLEKIKGAAIFIDSDLKNLGNLKLIEGTADFNGSKIENLGKLKEIGGNAYFTNSNVKDLGNLESVGGAIWFNNKIKDLGKLQSETVVASFNLNEELEKQYEERRQSQFAPRKQKNSVDRLVNEGKEQGKTDQEIRQDATAAGFTQKEISSALAKYYAKGEGIFTRSGKTGVTTRLYEGAKKLAQQYLTSKGLMPKIGFNLKERMEGEISKEANRAVNTAKKFGKLFDKYKGDKEALLEAFDKYIRGEKRVKLPAKFVGIANEMRNHIDTLSQMLINNGAVTGEMADTIQQNLGSYLSRSYEIYDNKNWKKKVGDQLVNQARNFLRTQPGTIAQAQADATAQNIPFNEALDNLVDNKIEDLFAEVQTEGFFKGSKVGAKDLSTLKFRQDIPEQIRMLMGEYTDPAMNYARTVNKLIHLAAQHKFLSDMREAGLGKFFFEKNDSLRPIGYNTQIAAKGSEVMAPLNGLYTTPEIFEAFQKQFNQKEIGAVMTFLYRVMGITKWLKTIASAATHMKNVFSNIGFVMANGHNILKLGPAIKVVANDLRTMSKPEVQAKIDEYIEAGIMRQGAGINEIRDMFKDANLDRFLEKRLSLKQPKSLMSKVKRAIGAPFIGFKTIAEALYQAEDDMFKIAAYENEVARYANSWYNKKPADLTEAERKIVVDKAADNVKNTYPTYSRIPEGIKQLRKFPLFIGSFISFQAESYRTAFNTIALAKEELLSGNKKLRTIGASRIAGASAYLTIKNAILSHFGMALGTGLSGVIGALYDDDDEKKKEEDVREFLPPWSKDSDIIPIKKSDGTIEYIDFSASDPHGALNKALNAFFRGDDLLDSFSKGLLATVEPFVGPDITVGLAMQLANNENDFGGKIYNEEDTFAEKTRKIADFVYKVIEPGTITSVRKVWKDEQPLMNSLFGEATGMKIRPLEVKKQFEFKMDTYADEFAEIKRIYKSEYNKTLRMMEDPKVSKKELEEQKKITEEAFNRANAQYAAKGKELMNLINSANRLGVDYDELIEAAKAKSVMNQTNLLEIQQGYPAKIEEKPY